MIKLKVNKEFRYVTGFLFVHEVTNVHESIKPVLEWSDAFDTDEVVEVDDTLISRELLAEVYDTPMGFIVVDGELKVRPYIKIEIDGQTNDKKEDMVVTLKINEKHKMKIVLYDPDNTNLFDLSEIKLKDRNGFLAMESQVVTLEDGVYEFEIESAFPGMAVLRAKDPEILAEFFTTTIRFKQ